MAWLNENWLARETRQARIDELSAIIAYIDNEFSSPNDQPDEITVQYYEVLKELSKLRRIHRAEVGLLYFAHEYFGDDYNVDNDGNWIPEANTPDTAPSFHREICTTMDDVSYVKRNAKIVVAAPRSHAKSSFLSKAYPIHEVVYRLRKYVIIISETPSVSKANMEWISNQLKFNEKLRADFGALLSPRDQANIKDNSDSNLMKGNTVKDNVVTGILLDSNSNENDVLFNRAFGNGVYLFSISKISVPTISKGINVVRVTNLIFVINQTVASFGVLFLSVFSDTPTSSGVKC